MRFQLEERVGRRRFRAVKAPGLGVWKKSRPGVRRLAVTQRVLELGEGASYRAVVKFRWYDGDRKLIRAARKRSRVCRQPGLLPNLRVRSVSGTRIAPDTVRYAVQIVNRGRAPAVNVGVRLAVDGDLLGIARGLLAPARRHEEGVPCGTRLLVRRPRGRGSREHRARVGRARQRAPTRLPVASLALPAPSRSAARPPIPWLT